MRKPGPGRLLPGLVQPFFRASCLAAALLAGMAVRVVLGPVPGSDWRSGFTSTHSAARRCAGAAMTMYLGTGLLSQQTKRGVAGSCCTASVPGTGGFSGLDVRSRSGRPRVQSHRIWMNLFLNVKLTYYPLLDVE